MDVMLPRQVSAATTQVAYPAAAQISANHAQVADETSAPAWQAIAPTVQPFVQLLQEALPAALKSSSVTGTGISSFPVPCGDNRTGRPSVRSAVAVRLEALAMAAVADEVDVGHCVLAAAVTSASTCAWVSAETTTVGAGSPSVKTYAGAVEEGTKGATARPSTVPVYVVPSLDWR
jgi:hypothetical protein